MATGRRRRRRRRAHAQGVGGWGCRRPAETDGSGEHQGEDAKRPRGCADRARNRRAWWHLRTRSTAPAHTPTHFCTRATACARR
ncbi:hypothetical protein BU14_0121s0038 [Porphyra umbilicalis]|uniref:Uncharacterized protein n=1 Tax=Porphyra umbilicalis TaxID=2786 RepID=A0A1X6PBI9_PORUM|nr:hypothetical protein BU14_0121s0038 [Porphyra umbilicalis]|eukprot:OSX78110.1 hypothetical protein BU14_0121s0038 [Porphyra umbilicalis]